MTKTELVEIKRNSVGTGLLIEHDGYISMSEGNNKQIFESALNQDEWHVPYPFIVDAVFQKCDIKNANGRIYPEKVLRKQIEVYQNKIREKRAYGELNHPADTTIDGGRISHNIVELHWEGKTVVGKLELHLSHGFIKHGIVSTMGDMAANLLLSGYKIGVSSRGIGSVEQKLGQLIVGDDFDLICWDIVTDPSTPNAWIGKNRNEIEMYVEDNNHTDENKHKKLFLEKINKVQNILKA
jgi:hypothetical protein